MKTRYISPFLLALPLFCSCKKYLDAKSDQKLVVPSTVQDVQALLDNTQNMNELGTDLGEAVSDNYYISDGWFDALPDNMKNLYSFQHGIYIGVTSNSNDWAFEYNTVYYANVVLDALNKIDRTPENASAWDNCKGSAMAYRGKAFYEIVQIWAKAYDSNSANSDLGIPLKLSPDFNTKSVRATINETYNRIIDDLNTAVPLLPNQPIHPMRPSKQSAYGLLSRACLSIKSYNKAILYSDSCLQINNQLLDYNMLDSTSSYPIPIDANPEDIMLSWCAGYSLYLLYPSLSLIDSSLYNSYDVNDLRRSIFFFPNGDGTYSFKGTYYAGYEYNGIATDEIYLIRSECNARLGNVTNAMTDLNTLMEKRWRKDNFTPFTANNSKDALQMILTERRKELIMRMSRLADIKRLNKGGADITLKRLIHGQTYSLPPNYPGYALPIPDDVIQASGMQQN